jgi:predicted AlkP superfamily phosphohydrolase/phosphomutase
MVLLSHGIGPHYGGDHLLSEILARLDDAERPSLWIVLGERARRLSNRRRRAARGNVSVDGSRRFFKIPNNELYGAIRFNLLGREPRGRVRPDDVGALTASLRADLLELVDPDDQRPIVRDVLRTDELYEGPARDFLPDLFVVWALDRPLAGATSPKIGTVRGTYSGIRTGDHRPNGLVFVMGRGITVGRVTGSVSVPVVDLGPTIAARLGVQLDGIDGAPIEALLGNQR